MGSYIGRADSVCEAHANYIRRSGADYVPRKFARKSAAYYGRIAWGLTPKEVASVLAQLEPCERGEFTGSYVNAYTSRSSSSGVGSFVQKFEFYSREDFDRVVGEGCDK